MSAQMYNAVVRKFNTTSRVATVVIYDLFGDTLVECEPAKTRQADTTATLSPGDRVMVMFGSAQMRSAPKWFVTGGGSADTVWIGPDPPTDPSIELWWDTDEPNFETTPWTALPLQNSWVSYAASDPNWIGPAYRKVGDMVQLRGLMARATALAAGTSQVFATLPVGFRPPASFMALVWVSYNGSGVRGVFRVDITAAGPMLFVYPTSYTNILATGVTYPTATSITHVNLDHITFSVTP